MNTSTYAVNLTDVVDEVVDGEAILINLKTGNYYNLDGSACIIWERLKDGACSTDELANHMRQCFDSDGQDMLADASQFLNELEVEGLLISAKDELVAETALTTNDRIPYSTPTITKYSDMEALLLIDPIHDVHSTGWPKKSEGES